MMPGSLTGSPGPALFSLIITGLGSSAMDIIYTLGGGERGVTAKYSLILVITLHSLVTRLVTGQGLQVAGRKY